MSKSNLPSQQAPSPYPSSKVWTPQQALQSSCKLIRQTNMELYGTECKLIELHWTALNCTQSSLREYSEFHQRSLKEHSEGKRAIILRPTVGASPVQYFLVSRYTAPVNITCAFVQRLLEALKNNLEIKVRWVLKNSGNSLSIRHQNF